MCRNEGRADGVGRAGTGVTWRTGTRVPLANREQRTQGLTNSSSATEAGEEGYDTRNRPRRQPLFAGARG